MSSLVPGVPVRLVDLLECFLKGLLLVCVLVCDLEEDVLVLCAPPVVCVVEDGGLDDFDLGCLDLDDFDFDLGFDELDLLVRVRLVVDGERRDRDDGCTSVSLLLVESFLPSRLDSVLVTAFLELDVSCVDFLEAVAVEPFVPSPAELVPFVSVCCKVVVFVTAAAAVPAGSQLFQESQFPFVSDDFVFLEPPAD